MKISIATTLYQSEDYVEEFYNRFLKVLKKLKLSDYEFIFVDDGSPDESFRIVQALATKDTKIKIIKLSRNFGHHKARITSLEHCTGDLIFYLDSDLEEDPENLEVFYKTLKEEKVDMIYAQRANNKRPSITKIFSFLFYFLFQLFTGFKKVANAISSRLMTRKYVDAVLSFPEREIYSIGINELAGFSRKSINIEKAFKGKSSYNLCRKLGLGIHAIISFSGKPLTLVAITGIVILLTSCTFLLFSQINILLISMWIICGIITSAIGISGLYISEILKEVKARPRVIIEEIING